MNHSYNDLNVCIPQVLHVSGSTAQVLFTERCSSVLEFCVIHYEAWTDTEPNITVVTKLK